MWNQPDPTQAARYAKRTSHHRFALLCEGTDDLGGDMEEEDGGNEGEGEDEDDEGVTREYRKTDEHHPAL